MNMGQEPVKQSDTFKAWRVAFYRAMLIVADSHDRSFDRAAIKRAVAEATAVNWSGSAGRVWNWRWN